MNKKFDIAVLGGGPGGYVAAIKASQSGKSVALIEAKELGGTCLNRGCIPSKALIANAETWHHVQQAEDWGIAIGSASFDFGKMAKRKDSIVSKTVKSLEGLIASNKISVIRGQGKLISPTEIKVLGADNLIVEADKIIIATGSEPRNLPAFPFDYQQIHDSTSILALTKLPKSLAIIGGGIIGCEFASLYAHLGVEVTILELMPTLIPTEDPGIAALLAKAFQKRGIKIQTQVSIEKIEKKKGSVSVILKEGSPVTAEMALVSVGRSLNTSDIGLEKAAVACTDKGVIPVNDKMETNVPGIYAIGDITGKWLLAHVASHQGIVAASNAVGVPAVMHYNAVPSIIYTDPEIATVGLSLAQAQAKGYQAALSAFPFQALGKSQALNQTEGMAQIVVDKKTGAILGAQVMGYDASTLIAEMAVAITNELTVESITETIHAHPALPEVWLEAAYLAAGTPIHWPPKQGRK